MDYTLITTAAGEVAVIPNGAILSAETGVWQLRDGEWHPITDPYEQSQELHGAAIANDRRRMAAIDAEYRKREQE